MDREKNLEQFSETSPDGIMKDKNGRTQDFSEMGTNFQGA